VKRLQEWQLQARERLDRAQEVAGSSPASSIRKSVTEGFLKDRDDLLATYQTVMRSKRTASKRMMVHGPRRRVGSVNVRRATEDDRATLYGLWDEWVERGNIDVVGESAREGTRAGIDTAVRLALRPSPRSGAATSSDSRGASCTGCASKI
jgi:hypothetical protein